MDEDNDEIGLAEAAQLLRLPYQSAHRLVLVGALAAVKRSGRWLVRRADAARLSPEIQQRAGALPNGPRRAE